MATICVLVSTVLDVYMPEPDIDKQVSAIRAFNRFYTRKIGVVAGMTRRPFFKVNFLKATTSNDLAG